MRRIALGMKPDAQIPHFSRVLKGRGGARPWLGLGVLTLLSPASLNSNSPPCDCLSSF